MSELITSMNFVLTNLNNYCHKTECLKCLPRIERGKCTYDEIVEIRNLLKGMGE